MGNDIGQCFQGTGHISKYGKHGYAKWEKKKTNKMGKIIKTNGDGVHC